MPDLVRHTLACACALALSGAHAADWGTLAEEAKQSFEPVAAEDLAAVRTALAERVIAAERLLRPTTPAGAAWLDYLAWEGIQKQLAPDATPDIPGARRTLQRLGSGADGLERRSMQQVAAAIADYVGVAQFGRVDPDRQRRAYNQAIDQLAEVANPDRVGSARGSLAIERALARAGGLEPAGRRPAILAAVREEFGQPNAMVDVGASLLNRLASRPVSDCTRVEDCILGTRIRGVGATSGTLTVTTVPAADRARLVFRLAGSTRSQTTGVNGPVRIGSTGVTSFTASKVVELRAESFSSFPASASASTRSQTRSVSKIGGGIGSRLIERIARNRIADKKSQADAIAGDHAADRVAAGLNERLDSEIARARRNYEDRLTKPLQRRLATPRSVRQWTTSDSLSFEVVQASGDQLAASGEAPAAVTAPLSARVHQTAVNNLLSGVLGGATIRRDSADAPPKLDIMAPRWLKLKAEPPAEGERFQPWSIRLRDPRPVSVEFTGGAITAIIHAAELKAEEKAYRGWDLIVSYEPAETTDGWRLVRQGEIDVLPTTFDAESGSSLGAGDVGLRNNLVKVLNQGEGRFPAMIDISSIDLSDRDAPIDGLALTALRLIDGWAIAGWRPQ